MPIGGGLSEVTIRPDRVVQPEPGTSLMGYIADVLVGEADGLAGGSPLGAWRAPVANVTVVQPPPPGPIVVVTDGTSLLDYLTAAGTVGAAVAGAFAAWAAWRSATAARTTASSAAETADRALEALSRALRTEQLQVGVWRGDVDPQDYTTPENWPGPLRIQVWNRGSVTAGDVRVTVTDSRGKEWPTLGPETIPAGSPHVWVLPDFEPACAPADPADPIPADRIHGTARHRLAVTFTDARGLLPWRQLYDLVERTNLGPDAPRRIVPQRNFTVPPVGLPELTDPRGSAPAKGRPPARLSGVRSTMSAMGERIRSRVERLRGENR